jgi:hypothetical protein
VHDKPIPATRPDRCDHMGIKSLSRRRRRPNR